MIDRAVARVSWRAAVEIFTPIVFIVLAIIITYCMARTVIPSGTVPENRTVDRIAPVTSFDGVDRIDYRAMFHDHEGTKEQIYLDPLGNRTGGVGHHFSVGSKLPASVIELLFEHDLRTAKDDVDAAVERYDLDLDPVRYAALVNLAFMLGRPNFINRESLFVALRDKKYSEAAEAWMRSKAAIQIQQARRDEIAKMLRRGETKYKAG